MYNVIFYEDKRGKSEIQKAKRNLKNYIDRRGEYEKQTFKNLGAN